ncbi:hypothetical protein K7G98_03960 [Saccharothrix sp. MB29]|nr:hypothetical protein [Saccharothrix sp. MB29]
MALSSTSRGIRSSPLRRRRSRSRSRVSRVAADSGSAPSTRWFISQ